MRKPVPESWREYRRRHLVATVGLLLGFPLAVLLAIALIPWTRQFGEGVLFLITCAWAILWGWAAFRVVRWPCPRCRKTWLSGQDIFLGAPRQCANCGLSLYEPP